MTETEPIWHTLAILGPNRWSRRPVLEVYLPQELATRNYLRAERCVTLLRSFLDTGRFTTTHSESVATAYAILDQLQHVDRNECTIATALLRVAEWMSAMAGVPVASLTPSCSLASSDDCVCDKVLPLEMEEELLAIRCFELAWELMTWASTESQQRSEEYPIAKKFRELFDYADDVRLGPSSRAILDAATARRIPYYRMTSGSLCQLGEGVHQRRIWTAETDATSAIAESIASDKDLTKRLLRNVGVPVPLGRLVTSPDDAWKAALEVGLPVVVKPKDANHQRGISIELTERNEVEKAYHWAIEDGQTQEVMVEQFARGQHHRLLVVGNRLIAAARGHWETVRGDGISTIHQLVEQLNEDPRRGEAYTDPLGVLKLDAAAKIELAKQGLEVESVPIADREVLVRRTGDLTTDCTEEVHPLTASQAVLAAKMIGLDIAGLDVLAEDISKPLRDQRGAVVEVNAGPSLGPHVLPLFGKPRPVGKAILEMLFPNNLTGTIPIDGLCATSDPDDWNERVSQWLLKRPTELALKPGQFVAAVTPRNIQVGDQPIDLGDANLRTRCLAVLSNPCVAAMLVVLPPRELLTHGLPVQRLDRIQVTADAIDEVRQASSEDLWQSVLNHSTTGTLATF